MSVSNPLQSRRRASAALVLTALMAVAGPALAQQGPRAEADWPSPVADKPYGRVLVDRLEYGYNNDEETLNWEADAFYGGDYNRLWFKTEGEDAVSDDEGGDIELADLVFSRLIAPFWDLQAGVGYQREYGPGDDEERFSGVIGVQGLAPYWFEVDARLRVSEEGDTALEFEAEYELLLTQRLILQPRLSTSYAFSEVEAFGVGEGLNDVGVGLRLRYEVVREFAPYIGAEWRRAFGDTADLVQAEGGDASRGALVAGVRLWF